MSNHSSLCAWYMHRQHLEGFDIATTDSKYVGIQSGQDCIKIHVHVPHHSFDVSAAHNEHNYSISANGASERALIYFVESLGGFHTSTAPGASET